MPPEWVDFVSTLTFADVIEIGLILIFMSLFIFTRARARTQVVKADSDAQTERVEADTHSNMNLIALQTLQKFNILQDRFLDEQEARAKSDVEVATLKGKFELMELKLEGATRLLTVTEDLMEQMRRKNNLLKKESARLEKDFLALSERIDLMQKDAEAHQAQLTTITEERDKEKLENDQLRESNRILTDERNTLSEKVEELQTQIDTLRDEVEQLKLVQPLITQEIEPV